MQVLSTQSMQFFDSDFKNGIRRDSLSSKPYCNSSYFSQKPRVLTNNMYLSYFRLFRPLFIFSHLGSNIKVLNLTLFLVQVPPISFFCLPPSSSHLKAYIWRRFLALLMLGFWLSLISIRKRASSLCKEATHHKALNGVEVRRKRVDCEESIWSSLSCN